MLFPKLKQACYRSRYAAGQGPHSREVFDDFTRRIEIHFLMCGQGSFFAKVQRFNFSGFGVTNHSKASTTDIASFRMDNGECKADRYADIKSVATPFKYIQTDISGN